jgi:hypothetical protein
MPDFLSFGSYANFNVKKHAQQHSPSVLSALALIVK